jgi:hypothetical protein
MAIRIFTRRVSQDAFRQMSVARRASLVRDGVDLARSRGMGFGLARLERRIAGVIASLESEVPVRWQRADRVLGKAFAVLSRRGICFETAPLAERPQAMLYSSERSPFIGAILVFTGLQGFS